MWFAVLALIGLATFFPHSLLIALVLVAIKLFD